MFVNAQEDLGLVPDVLLAGCESSEEDSIRNMIIGQGYSVSTLSLQEVGDIVNRDPLPCLIILSSHGSNDPEGSEFCRCLKSDELTEGIPILIISDQGEIVEWPQGYGGIFDFIRRPFAREDMLARIKLNVKIVSLSSQLKKVHTQLVEAQKMECIGALAAGVAHEFNNLMFSVMGFAEMAKAQGDIEALKESAEISYETAKRASATATSLLAFSRKSKALKGVGDINEVINSAIRLLRRDMEKNNIEVTLDLAELPETNFATGPVQQVILNLIINAWHAMMDVEAEKKISITTSCDDGSRINILVSDTGIGMSKGTVAKIFDPFWTTKGKRKGRAEGSGLGLSIVKEVVKDHGGIITVKSEEGKGTCFSIVLPVVRNEAVEADMLEASSEISTQIGAKKFAVLIVDDEEANRRILTRLLTKAGHEAYSAANLAEAMSLWWSKKIDLITMDLIMPSEEGVANIIKLREEGIGAPILICTGHVDNEMISRGLKAGANGVIMKPFSASEFLFQMYSVLLNARDSEAGMILE